MGVRKTDRAATPPATAKRKTPEEAKDAFHDNVARQTGRVIGPYLTALKPVECVCAVGHTCWPRPASPHKGNGMCDSCAQDNRGIPKKKNAERVFRDAVENWGGQVVGSYLGANEPVKCICPEGHICGPRPSAIWRGEFICRTCSGTDPKLVHCAFYRRVEELGGRVVGTYVSATQPVECICGVGHTCWPKPSKLRQGRGLCRICSGKDPATAEAASAREWKALADA